MRKAEIKSMRELVLDVANSLGYVDYEGQNEAKIGHFDSYRQYLATFTDQDLLDKMFKNIEWSDKYD